MTTMVRKRTDNKTEDAETSVAMHNNNDDCEGNGDKCRVSWVIDSGCSSHMIKEKYVIDNFYHISRNVLLADKGNMLKSEGIGSINGKFKIDNKYGNNVYLEDTLFV